MSVSRLHNNKTGKPDGTFRLKFWWWEEAYEGSLNCRQLQCTPILFMPSLMPSVIALGETI